MPHHWCVLIELTNTFGSDDFILMRFRSIQSVNIYNKFTSKSLVYSNAIALVPWYYEVRSIEHLILHRFFTQKTSRKQRRLQTTI